MIRRRDVLVLGVMLCVLCGTVLGFQSPAQSEFVPVSQVPASDQLPAARLLIAAYAFVWTALMVYLWSIWRRIGKVEADMRALDRRSTERGAR